MLFIIMVSFPLAAGCLYAYASLDNVYRLLRHGSIISSVLRALLVPVLLLGEHALVARSFSANDLTIGLHAWSRVTGARAESVGGGYRDHERIGI